MSEESTILVPVDFSDFSRAAIERALVLAKASGAKLRLLHALQLPPIAIEYNLTGPVWTELRASETAKLEELRREFEGRGPAIDTSFEERDATQAILSAARAPDVELVVMGSHGRRGLDHLLLGSVAERTLQSCPVPLMIVREGKGDAASPIRSILFATDFSECAQRAEDVVAEWSRRLDSDVEVLHVIYNTAVLFAPYAVPDTSRFDDELWESANRRMERVLDRFQGAGVAAKAEVIRGIASEEILKRAESTDAQLIAMGTQGHSGLSRFRLGSVAQRVLRGSPCSVLISGGMAKGAKA